MNRYVIPLIVFIGLVVLLAVGLRLDPREVPSPFIGKPAPVFNLASLHDENKIISPANLQGQVWILNVWASWCVSCRQEHPLLMELAKTRQVPIYGLNYKDEKSNAMLWLKQWGDPYQVSAFDAEGSAGIDWGVYGVPETFVIDKQGIVRHKHIGVLQQKDLDEKIMPLVKQLQNIGQSEGGNS